jgi:hypothetical protein
VKVVSLNVAQPHARRYTSALFIERLVSPGRRWEESPR